MIYQKKSIKNNKPWTPEKTNTVRAKNAYFHNDKKTDHSRQGKKSYFYRGTGRITMTPPRQQHQQHRPVTDAKREELFKCQARQHSKPALPLDVEYPKRKRQSIHSSLDEPVVLCVSSLFFLSIDPASTVLWPRGCETVKSSIDSKKNEVTGKAILTPAPLKSASCRRPCVPVPQPLMPRTRLPWISQIRNAHSHFQLPHVLLVLPRQEVGRRQRHWTRLRDCPALHRLPSLVVVGGSADTLGRTMRFR